MNLKQLRERSKTRYRDPANVMTTDETWDGHLNAGQYEFVAAAEWPLRLREELVVFQAGLGAQDLPRGVYKVQAVVDVDGDDELEGMPLREAEEAWPDRDDRGSPVAYTVRGNELLLFPVPDQKIDLRVTYHEEPPPMEHDPDEPAFPERFHEALVHWAVAAAHADDANLDAANYYHGQFERIVGRARQELLGPSRGTYVTVPSSRGA